MGSNNGTVPVLVVDSEPASLLRVEPVLQSLGDEVICVRSEREALERLSEQEFAAVLIDAHMPEMDGFEAARHIRQQRGGQRVPIILFDTDEMDEERMQDQGNLGAVDLIHRNFAPEVLKSKVQLLGDLYSARAEAGRFRREAARYCLLLEKIEKVAVFTLDSGGRFTEWDAGAERLFGYPRDEIVGQVFSVLFSPDDKANMIPEKDLRTAAADGQCRKQSWLFAKGGKALFVQHSTTALRDETGTLTGYAVVNNDLTEARLTHDALCESEERYRLVAQATNDVIYDYNLATHEIIWNAAMRSVFGYSTEEFLANFSWWTEHIHPEDRERTSASLGAAVESPGWTWTAEYRFRRANGDYAQVLDRGQFLRDSEGKAVRMIGSMVDVTEQHRAAEEVRRARDLAIEASLAKSQFLANMSHELRSPLTAILGYAELLSEELTEKGMAQLTPDVEKIHLAGDHLLAIISDILDLSKIEAGKLKLRVEPFDVGDTVREAVATVMPQVNHDAVRVKIVSACQNRTMRSDQTRVRQILINLLSNGAKFTHTGEIRIECLQEECPGAGKWFLFRVCDTGIGMTPEQLGKLFKRFHQLDTSPTRRYGGTGLGLAICQLLCDALGGTINVESESRRGSTFTVRLPAEISAHATDHD